MWWIFIFYDFYIPFAVLWQFFANLDIGMHLGKFLFAGIIPGTNIEVSFYQLATLVWILLIIVLGKSIAKLANNKTESFRVYKKAV